jgi:molybdopterin-guanine dinucleotide biosynthesis protein A
VQELAVILAGGVSRRMGGGDKFRKKFQDMELIEHVIGRLQPQVKQIVISANGDLRRLDYLAVPVIPDPFTDRIGPLAGILAAMDWFAGSCSHCDEGVRILSAAADTPFLPADLAAKLRAAGNGAVVAASQGRIHPTAGLWPLGWREKLQYELTCNGLRKMHDWLDMNDFRVVEFEQVTIGDALFDPFFNINTPEQLAVISR